MFVAVMAVAVTMRVAVAMNVRDGGRDGSRRAIVLVIPGRVIVGMRVHSRYIPFYARRARLAKCGALT